MKNDRLFKLADKIENKYADFHSRRIENHEKAKFVIEKLDEIRKLLSILREKAAPDDERIIFKIEMILNTIGTQQSIYYDLAIEMTKDQQRKAREAEEAREAIQKRTEQK